MQKFLTTHEAIDDLAVRVKARMGKRGAVPADRDEFVAAYQLLHNAMYEGRVAATSNRGQVPAPYWRTGRCDLGSGGTSDGKYSALRFPAAQIAAIPIASVQGRPAGTGNDDDSLVDEIKSLIRSGKPQADAINSVLSRASGNSPEAKRHRLRRKLRGQ